MRCIKALFGPSPTSWAVIVPSFLFQALLSVSQSRNIVLFLFIPHSAHEASGSDDDDSQFTSYAPHWGGLTTIPGTCTSIFKLIAGSQSALRRLCLKPYRKKKPNLESQLKSVEYLLSSPLVFLCRPGIASPFGEDVSNGSLIECKWAIHGGSTSRHFQVLPTTAQRW